MSAPTAVTDCRVLFYRFIVYRFNACCYFFIRCSAYFFFRVPLFGLPCAIVLFTVYLLSIFCLPSYRFLFYLVAVDGLRAAVLYVGMPCGMETRG